MKRIKCVICGDTSQYRVLYKANYKSKDIDPKKYVSRRPPDKSHFQIVKCIGCGMIFSNPVVEKDKILSSYKNSDFYPEEDIENLTDVYEYYVDAKIPKTQRNKILEIGCGNGRLLARFAKLGFKSVYGVEPSRKAVLSSPQWVNKKNLIVDFFKENQFKKNYFESIVFMQVLDHVIDPNKFLHEVYRILRPGGYVLAIVHNSRSWSVKLFGERSPIIDIQHINLFDKKNLKRIFTNNGFKVISVFDTFTKYSIAYWIKILPIPNVIKKVFNKFNFLKEINVKVYAGNMGILVRKSK